MEMDLEAGDEGELVVGGCCQRHEGSALGKNMSISLRF